MYSIKRFLRSFTSYDYNIIIENCSLTIKCVVFIKFVECLILQTFENNVLGDLGEPPPHKI